MADTVGLRAAGAALTARIGWGARVTALLDLLTSVALAIVFCMPAVMIAVAVIALVLPLFGPWIGLQDTAKGLLPGQVALALGLLLGSTLLARLCCRIQRARLSDTFGMVESTPPDPLRPRTPVGRAVDLVIGPGAWSALLYSTIAGVQALIAGALALFLLVNALGAALGLVLMLLGGAIGLSGTTAAAPSQQLLQLALGAVGGAVGLWIAPSLVTLEVAVARRLLFDAPEVRARRRLAHLQDSRSRMVDAAEAERRRIERDLHDGAQQSLLAVTLTLTRARATFDRDPDQARTLVEQAQREARSVMDELRDVARGLHPKVLTDHGLPAALPVAAGRSPLPVRVDADLPERPSPRAEGVAYYVASEALTNIAKHAAAGRARISAHRLRTGAGDVLRLEVADDGGGGADPDRGTGLHGLTDRVEAVDGTLRVHSPEGEGTVLTADIPWEA
ncbi:sensor histidine kinase [Nocardiopsis coralliicola]